MKLYTRTGDAGTTSLVGGTRVPKDDLRLDAYGTVDELNSHIGLVIAQARATGFSDQSVIDTLLRIQHTLFDLGCQLATEPHSKWQPKAITPEDVAAVEAEIDRLDDALTPMHAFILPGGTLPAAQAQIARTVARRAERLMVALSRTAPVADPAMQYVNRLSDYLFALARYFNHVAQVPETTWS